MLNRLLPIISTMPVNMVRTLVAWEKEARDAEERAG